MLVEPSSSLARRRRGLARRNDVRNLASFLRFDDFSPLTTTETTRKKLKRGEDGEDLTDEFEEEKKKQTDEDIIVYYLTCAERGERPKREFFMCERKSSYEKTVADASGKEPYDAYALVEIDEKERKRREREEKRGFFNASSSKEDLFIVSATAVVHHPADGSASKCYALSEWMREKHLVRAMRCLSTYARYRERKAIRIWRAEVRRRLFERTRMQIEKRAFVASERFAPAMQKLFAIASAIDETSFVPKRDGFAYTAEAFKTHYDTHRVKVVQPAIDLKVEEATRVANRVNASVVRSCAMLGSGGMETDSVEKEEEEEGDGDEESDERMVKEEECITKEVEEEFSASALLMAPAPSLSSSTSLAEEASKMRKREKTRKILEREKDRLGHFTRFCDLVVNSQLAESVIKVSETVLNEINTVQADENNNDGVFVVEALFPAIAGVTTALTPEFDALLENIEKSSCSHSLQLVNSVPRILSATATSLPADADVPFLAQTFSASKIAKESARAHEAMEKARSRLREDFDKAIEYCALTQFMNARAIYDFGETNPTRELVKVEGKNKPPSTEDFTSALSIVAAWTADIDSIEKSRQIGSLRVDTSKIKKIVTPICTEAAIKVKERLITTAKAKTVALLSTLEASTEMLRDYPKTGREESDEGHCEQDVKKDDETGGQVSMNAEDGAIDTRNDESAKVASGALDESVRYKRTVVKAAENVRSFEMESVSIETMYSLASTHSVKIPAHDQVKLDDLRVAVEEHGKALEDAKTYLDTRDEANIAILKSESERLEKSGEEIFEQLPGGPTGEEVMNECILPSVVIESLKETRMRLDGMRDRAAALKSYAETYSLSSVESDARDGVEGENIASNVSSAFNFRALDDANRELTIRETAWEQLNTFQSISTEWMHSAIVDVNVDSVLEKIEKTKVQLGKLKRMRKDKRDEVVSRLDKCVQNFEATLPALETLSSDALKERHWKDIRELLNVVDDNQPVLTLDDTTEDKFISSELSSDSPTSTETLSETKNSSSSTLTLEKALEAGLQSKIDVIRDIVARASKENALESALIKMEKDWDGIDFVCTPYKDTGTCVLGGTEDAQALLDDQLVKTQSIRASPFSQPFGDRAVVWSETLQRLQDTLDQWGSCQATWQYLEPIFASEDIVKQMPVEGEKFKSVDQMYRNVVDATAKNPSAIQCGRDETRLQSLEAANTLLDEIQRGLQSYLELKRIAFPRFFFLSNDEMLEILSETKDPRRVQPHLRKCFEGIDSVTFEKNEEDDREYIVAMNSVEGEEVPFNTFIEPAKANGAVERWLCEVETSMLEAVEKQCAAGVRAYATTERKKWVLEWPGQVVLLGSQIYWTRDIAEALRNEKSNPGSVKKAAEKCDRQLKEIIELVRGDLTPLQRKTLSALVVMDVHNRDVARKLAEDGVSSERDFSWLSQLRATYELKKVQKDDGSCDRKETVMLRMMNASVEYGYEYLGNSSRLVITPLTDRCYRTLMGAIHLNLGGAPEGPAGTGKTETTKDLAKALARQCVVFNCSDSLDYLTMARFFKGLASSGAWACFDEFNRIDLEVLSVVAQQVLEIQIAVKNNVKKFFFEGSELTLRPTCNVFITMNPGYAGRSELPDNLKALFRTVAMMVPDYALISEILLYSDGYLNARACARKIVATYRLCSEQLSSQDHYDYGMRAVIAVLRAAGNLKRKHPEECEFVLTLRAIIDVNLCKFLAHDVPLFYGIVGDLFPGVVLPKTDYENLHAAVIDQCTARNLQPTEYFLTKITQLYEMIVVRHGLMLVGETMSGKSSALAVLAGALTDLHEKGLNDEKEVIATYLNPKAVTMGQLYGETDNVTQEWREGVLGLHFRKLANMRETHIRKWLVMDGPVDAIWIENMNTVLDDNKKLCLPNSEIIAMTGLMNLIFEVADLAVASPATVSRCGMVYMEPAEVGWKPQFKSWVSGARVMYGNEAHDRLSTLFETFLPASVEKVGELKKISPAGEGNLTASLTRLFDATLKDLITGYENSSDVSNDAAHTAGIASDESESSVVSRYLNPPITAIDASFLFALVWSVGGCVDTKSRSAFDTFLKSAIASKTSSLSCPETFWRDESATVYDFKISAPKGTGVERLHGIAWQKWIDSIPAQARIIPKDLPFDATIVPTKETATCDHLLDCALRHGYPILFCGPTGTGKSTIVQRRLRSLDKSKWQPTTIGFSARTSANATQAQVDGRLDKRRKGVYGPIPGAKGVFFIDDVNMPQRESYGAQPPIEILRQFHDYGGWYGRDNAFVTLQDIQFVAAMGPAGGGRNPVTERYLRHFSLVSVPEVDESALKGIYNAILSQHFQNCEFHNSIVNMAPDAVCATLVVYQTCLEKLLPTPEKSHYSFNLRDFSRVAQGLTMLPLSQVENESDFGRLRITRLWTHEILRVFGDRLVDVADERILVDSMRVAVSTHFRENFDGLFSHLNMNDTKLLAFGKYANPPKIRDEFDDDDDDDANNLELQVPPPSYEELSGDAHSWVSIMDEHLNYYNHYSKQPMNITMFVYAAEHISRICRILAQPGGHALLVGVGGSGRKSLARLAAHASGEMFVKEIEMTKTYGMLEWREDLKNMLRMSGGENRDVVFLFSDAQIKDEAFIEDINNLLNAGEIPNAFPTDEKAQVLEMVRKDATKEIGEDATQSELWAYFVSRCRRKLHVVLCLSPAGEAFRERLRQFPSLVNCCTIDWFKAWPEDALEAVAGKILRESVDGISPEAASALTSVCGIMHSSVAELSERYYARTGRKNYVTPTSYLELLSTFASLVGKRREETMRLKRRYEVGLEKLASSAEQVAGMQSELEALQPKLKESAIEVAEMMKEIQNEKETVVEPKRKIVEADEAVAAEKAREANGVKEECENILAEAMPILNDAIAALDTLKPADINYVKQLKNPPAIIKLVLEAVCVILEVKPARAKDPDTGRTVDDYWKPSCGLLNDKDFLETLKSYDKDNIPIKVIQKIRSVYISNPLFTPEKAANASSAAEGLCKWVCAMDKYDKVAKIVAPKQEALKEAEAAYDEVMVGLNATRADLKTILDKLEAMETELKKQNDKKANLEAEANLCAVKLQRAESLISGLGGERARWKKKAEDLGRQYENIVGDAILSAGTIAYLGAFPMSCRQEMHDMWMHELNKSKIICSTKCELIDILGDAVRIREWQVAALPNDQFSIENAIIIENARRWPLMIDPQGQANAWIKNMEKKNNLRVVKLSEDGAHMRELENAIQFGTPVLLENVGEELDPSLEPLLLKQTFKSGGVTCMRLGDATVEYSEDFRLYITTKLRNPHYLPETAVKVTLLDFAITREGLSDQLLALVVAKERPDLEKQKDELVTQSAKNARELKQLEDQILEVLSNSDGNILDDERAIKIITDSKSVSESVTQAQAEAEETEKDINAARSAYSSSGSYAALLFFCISDLAAIESMYQYSLQWFSRLFIASVVNSKFEKATSVSSSVEETAVEDSVDTRLRDIRTHFTKSLYDNVCRSLFECDKLLFSFSLCSRISRDEGMLDGQEWNFLLTGVQIGSKVDKNLVEKLVQTVDWIDEKRANDFANLSFLSRFSDICESILDTTNIESQETWKAAYDSPTPHEAAFPKPYDTLSEFSRLCIIRCLRPDKLIPAARKYVGATLGEQFITPPTFDLEKCYADAGPRAPLVFVLSAGSDPMAKLLQFAASKGEADAVKSISLGQGQGPKAKKLIDEARVNGGWVVLQNCHLAPSWMKALEKICEDLVAGEGEAHNRFRLWMTSYPSKDFPMTILQNAVKMTNEPPRGIRANVKRALSVQPLCDDDFFDKCARPNEFKRLLFSLCFFHANVQERRAFGPIGWNVPYGFDDGDLSISARQLKMFLDEKDEDEEDGSIEDEATGGAATTVADDDEKALVSKAVSKLPLEALRYLAGECNYGGRVTDANDRILLATILEKCYSEEAASSNNFALSASGKYATPSILNPSRAQLLEHVDALPALPEPEVFGLHANADVSKDRADAEAMCRDLLKMSGDSASEETNENLETEESGEHATKEKDDCEEDSSSTTTNEAADTNTALKEVINDAIARLPSNFNVEKTREKLPDAYADSLGTTLCQEMSRYNKLLLNIRKSLHEIEAALAGRAAFSAESEASKKAIERNAVPEAWKKVSYPSLKPFSSYFDDLLERCSMLETWDRNGKPPAVFWISGFFFAQSFLTAALQNYSRKHKLPVDEIAFDFEPIKGDVSDITEPPEAGVYVSGLFLEGCGWDEENMQLVESEKNVLHSKAPIFWFKPRKADEIKQNARYDCPCYRTAERRGTLATTGHSTNFVMHVKMPTKEPAEHWIKRGVALVTQLSE